MYGGTCCSVLTPPPLPLCRPSHASSKPIPSSRGARRVSRGGHGDDAPCAVRACVSEGEDFKGTTRTEDGVECSLGRLVFNIFEPVEMPILITSIENNLGPRPEDASSAYESPYEIATHFVARDGCGLRGISTLKGVVAEDPSDSKRLVIKFSMGTIEPEDGQDLDSWSEVIGVKDATAEGSKGPLSWVKRKAKGLVLKLLLGFREPADELGSRGELSYEMRRSPSATVDVIYIDDDMRIVRGSRGALVVATRQ